MFKFTLSENFKQRGVSPDAISPEMRNRFEAIFNENEASVLDKRIQVQLDETVIRFFFYKGDINADVPIKDKYQEIAYVLLNNVKETGHDILCFKEMVERNCKKEMFYKYGENKFDEDLLNIIVQFSKNLVGYTDDKEYGSRLFNFPFVDSWNYKDDKFDSNETEEERFKWAKKWFAFFMQCCFLHFLFEFESIESDFSNSPIYDKVRDNLRQSEVYQLLCAKVKYTMRLFEGTAPLGEEDYNTITLKYADLLMDKNHNKVVPHDYYMEQLWFYNPESELDFILQRNNKNCKKCGEAKLSDKLYGKIRDFFFTRHAMVSAMGNRWTKNTYRIYLFIIGIFSVFATVCLSCFDSNNDTVDWFFNHIVWWDWIAAGALGVLVVLWCSTRSLSVFMPRVLVAIGIGWLTTFISEDIIKSQVSIDKPLTVAACIGVLFLISLLLLGEIRKDSPYYFGSIRQYHEKLSKEKGWGKSKLGRLSMWVPAFLCFVFDFKRAKQPSSWKLVPILIHSYFWALTLGVVMQLALYKDLLKNSKALQEIVFVNTFQDAEQYIMHLTNFKEALVDYRHDLENRAHKTTISGLVREAGQVSILKADQSYSDHEIERIKEQDSIRVVNIKRKFKKVKSLELKTSEQFVFPIIDVKDSLEGDGYLKHVVLGKTPFVVVENCMDSLSDRIMMLNNTSKTQVESYDSLQHGNLRTAIMIVEEEIQIVESFIVDNNNYEILIDWGKDSCPLFTKEIDYCGFLMAKAKNRNNICHNARLWWIKDKGEKGFFIKDRNNYLFPRMLIFHSLIVLIIAFVGNLIISDKSVTEPL